MKAFLTSLLFGMTVWAQGTALMSSQQNQINHRTNNKFEIDLDTFSQINNMSGDSSLEDVVNSLKLYFSTTSFYYSFSERMAKNPYVHENFLTQMKIEGKLTPLFIQALSQLYAEDLTTFTSLVFRTFPMGSFQEVTAKRDKVYNCFVESALSTQTPECLDTVITQTILTPSDFSILKFAYTRMLRMGKIIYNFDYDRSVDGAVARNCEIIVSKVNELKTVMNQVTMERSTTLGVNHISQFASLPSLNPLSGPAFSHSKKGLQYLCKTSFNPLLD